MIKEVKIKIRGQQWGEDMDPATVVTEENGEYYYKNRSHYLLYEEYMEESSKPSKTRIKWNENKLELVRQGLVDTHMIFEEKKTHMTDYVTPYGRLILGINTGKLTVEETEEEISILVEYQLELEGEKLSGHKLEMWIKPAI